MGGQDFVEFLKNDPHYRRQVTLERERASYAQQQLSRALSRADLRLYNALISEFARAKQLATCLRLYSDLLSLNLRPSDYTFTNLINACVRCGDFPQALFFYDRLCAVSDPGVAAFTALLRGADVAHSRRLLADMARARVAPNLRTYQTLLRTAARCGDAEFAVEVFDRIPPNERNGCEIGALVRALCQGFRLQAAEAALRHPLAPHGEGALALAEAHALRGAPGAAAAVLRAHADALPENKEKCVQRPPKKPKRGWDSHALFGGHQDAMLRARLGALRAHLDAGAPERAWAPRGLRDAPRARLDLRAPLDFRDPALFPPLPVVDAPFCPASEADAVADAVAGDVADAVAGDAADAVADGGNDNAVDAVADGGNEGGPRRLSPAPPPRVRVELCSGHGDWAVSRAAADARAGVHWICCELRRDRAFDIWTRRELAGCARNLLLLCGDAQAAVRAMPRRGVEELYVNFPTPPLDSDSRERLVDEALLRDVGRVLQAQGTLFVLTDCGQYALEIARELRKLPEMFESRDRPAPWTTKVPKEYGEKSYFDEFWTHGKRKIRYLLRYRRR